MNKTHVMFTNGMNPKVIATLEGGSYQWVNQDCPELYLWERGNLPMTIFSYSLFYGLKIYEPCKDLIINFIKKSDKRFMSKFKNKPWIKEMSGLQYMIEKINKGEYTTY